MNFILSFYNKQCLKVHRERLFMLCYHTKIDIRVILALLSWCQVDIVAEENCNLRQYMQPKEISASNLDQLVVAGVRNIVQNGERFNARAGSGQQDYGVSYTLIDPTDRLHLLRQPRSVRYFCREMLAYFNGSLKVEDGLAQASPFWRKLADQNGEICSNYGYYVFHQRIASSDSVTQYEWVVSQLARNLDSRKAFININQPHHKGTKSQDFPCTIGMQFFVRQNHLCCAVSSRSTDIYTGLPYDMGFFSFVAELVYRDLKSRLPKEQADELKLGPVTMRTNFTQIYDKTRSDAVKLMDATVSSNSDRMPEIENAQAVLNDIYNGTANTSVMKWIKDHAELS